MKTPATNTSLFQRAKALPRGFSLLEVMIVAGLMSVVGLAITSIVSNSSKMQKHLEQKDTALNISGSIRALLQNQDLCKSAFCATGATCNSPAAGLLTGTFPTRPPGNATVAPILLSGVQMWNGSNTVSPISVVKCLTSEKCNETEPKIGSPVASSPGLFVVAMAIRDVRFAAQQGANTDLVSGKLSITLQHDRKTSQGVAQFRPLEFDINFIVNKDDGQMLGCSGGGINEIWKRSAANSANIFYTDGNVGIGNSIPTHRLHVKGNAPATTDPAVRIENNSTNSSLLFDSGTAGSEFLIGAHFPAAAFKVARATSFGTTNDLLIVSQAGTSIGGGVGPKTLSSTAGSLDLVSPDSNVRLITGNPGAVRLNVDAVGAVTVPTSLSVGTVGGAGTTMAITGPSTFGGNVAVTGTGTLTVAGATTLSRKLTVQADGADITGTTNLFGSVNIGNATTQRDLTVSGVSYVRQLSSVTGSTSINVANHLQVNGNITGNGTNSEIRDFRVISTSSGTTSDIRLKKNVIPLSRQSDIISQIMTYSYNYIEDVENTLHFGFVAQELKKLFPSLVRKDSKGFYYINTSELIPIAIKGLQESNERILELENKVDSLEQRLNRLEALLENQSSN